MKFSNHEQGSEAWLAERRGLITASRFRDALDTVIDVPAKQAKVDKKTGEVIEPARPETRKPSFKSMLYAQDVARERCGGTVFGQYVNAQMRYGTEQEPSARIAYEVERGVMVSEVGFFKDESERFGISTDGLVEDDGAVEIKCICSSDVLFTLLVDKDYSSFIHQIFAHHWMLDRKWVDLVIWTPDLAKRMHIVRFERDEEFIGMMEAKLLDFSRTVDSLTLKLKDALA